MTWQHIDENTYIDDTLVTCAEYQLFIDEMREKRKYYHPDHWSSFHFSKEQAKEPILGLRPTDARSFCTWLSNRELGNWVFRLPKSEEANLFKISKPNQDRFAYWVNGKGRSAWPKSVQINPRALSLSRLISVINSLDLGIQGTDIANEFEKDLNAALQRASCLNISRDLSFVESITRRNEFNSNIKKEIKYFLNRKNNYELVYQDAGAFQDTSDKAFMFALDLMGDERYQLALDLCIDIITLKERRMGRSPAFEGIRLVKERIK